MTLLPLTDHGNVYVLAAQLAASSTFQAAVNETTQAAALEHISYPFVKFDESGAVVDDLEPPRIVISDELGQEEMLFEAHGELKRLEQTLWVTFDLVPPKDISSESVLNEWAWFTSRVRTILRDAQKLGGIGNPVGSITYSHVSFLRTRGPYRQDQSESGRLPDPAGRVPDIVWHAAYEATLILG